MLWEYLVRSIDEMSYMYMGKQKNAAEVAAAIGSLEEYVENENAREPLEYFKNPGYVPDMKISSPSARRNYNIMRFQFDSPVYTRHRANNVVHGRYYERHGRPDLPMVILLHGWRMESYLLFDRYCRLLVRDGINCAMPDLPYHMNRTPRDSFAGEHTFKEDAIHTMETMRQSLFDVMSVANWAKKKKGARLVGVMGVSFGGLLSGLMACVEPLVDFAVLVCPASDLGEIFQKSRLGRLFEKENPRAARLITKYKDTLAGMSLPNLKPLLPPERIFIAHGIYDAMVPEEVTENLWHSWDKPVLKRYPHGHLSIILLNPQLESDLKEWLKSMYNLPPASELR